MRLNEAIGGTWWQPGGEPALGELSQDADGSLRIRLQAPAPQPELPLFCPLVLGKGHSGDPFSLMECTLLGTQLGSTGGVIEYWVDTVVAGVHVTEGTELRCSAARLSFPSLTFWLGSPLISELLGRNGPRIADAVRSPSFLIDSAVVEPSRYVVTHYDSSRRLMLEEMAHLDVRFPVARPLKELLDGVVNPLEHLLSFAAGRREMCSVLAIARASAQLEPDPTLRESASVRVYASRRSSAGVPARHPHEFLFTYNDVVEMAPGAPGIWFGFSPRFQDALATWLRSECDDGASIAECLRNAVSCLDALFQEIHDSEAKLREELQFHLKTAEDAVSVMLTNREAFIDAVIDSRNYWTHFGKRPATKAVRETQLGDYNSVLSLLVRACLLRHLGFSSNDMLALLGRNSKIRCLRDRLRLP